MGGAEGNCQILDCSNHTGITFIKHIEIEMIKQKNNKPQIYTDLIKEINILVSESLWLNIFYEFEK